MCFPVKFAKLSRHLFWSHFEEHLRTTASLLSQGIRAKFYETEFSCKQKKKIKIQSLKQNLRWFTWYNYLLSLNQQSQDLGLLLLQGLDCLTLLSLHLLILYNELVMHLFRTSLSLFSSCKSDLNSRSCSITFCCFYSQCHFHLATHVFLSLQIFPLLFSHFLSFLFFVFDIDCLFWVLLWFYVYFLQISL